MATGNFFSNATRTVTLEHVYQGLEKPDATQFKANSLIWDRELEAWYKNVSSAWVAASASDFNAGVGGGATSLSDLSDVTTTGVADGQALVYDAGTGDWGPSTIDGGSGSSTLGGLTDVTIVSPQDNDIIFYQASTSTWRRQPFSTQETYSSTSDLTTALGTMATKDTVSNSDIDSGTIATEKLSEATLFGRFIVETSSGTWTADAPSRGAGENPIVFIGANDPASSGSGITTPANIQDYDIWIDTSV